VPGRSRTLVGALLVVLAGYLALTVGQGFYLLSRPNWTLRLFGAAVLVLALLGAWVVVAELRFGRATQRLAAELPSGPDEEVGLARRPSGRVERAAADALFARRRAAVETAPNDWREWYRLALAYDLAGDRRRARAAMRTAIARHTGGSVGRTAG
jgi:hypothetical protein